MVDKSGLVGLSLIVKFKFWTELVSLSRNKYSDVVGRV